MLPSSIHRGAPSPSPRSAAYGSEVESAQDTDQISWHVSEFLFVLYEAYFLTKTHVSAQVLVFLAQVE